MIKRTINEALEASEKEKERLLLEYKKHGVSSRFHTKNAKIQNVSIDMLDEQLVAYIEFVYEWGGTHWTMLLTNSTEVRRLAKLFSFAGADTLNNLNGKIVRLAFSYDFVCGIGDPVEDKFVQFTGEDLEVISLQRLEELQK